jgi:hypothetical protein
MIGRGGAGRIHEWELSPDELAALHAAGRGRGDPKLRGSRSD